MAKISYHFRPDAAGRELSVRHAGLRGRGRSGNRRCRYRQLRRCRRRRSRGQPDDLHGQTHGGIAQGAGQALLEDCHYDPRTGQLLAASFMDYAMPRADTLPALATALSEVPAPTNRLGVRSGGEGGTTPALAVVINAIVDALTELGVRHIEMPATPERVWRAIREANGRRQV